MKMVATLRDGHPLFRNHKDICNTIDATDLGDIPWEQATLWYQGDLPPTKVPEWMTTEYEIYFQDPSKVVKSIIADPMFNGAFDYVPYQEFNQNGDQQYENLMSGDWAYQQAVRLYNSNRRDLFAEFLEE